MVHIAEGAFWDDIEVVIHLHDVAWIGTGTVDHVTPNASDGFIGLDGAPCREGAVLTFLWILLCLSCFIVFLVGYYSYFRFILPQVSYSSC